MLCELKVDNLALIETLHLVFEQRGEAELIVMTGETGAGKSIMMRAIGLLTGARGSADWIRSGAENCTVEALFEVQGGHTAVRQLLADGGFGEDTSVVIKRVITPNGRSRLYINGSLATARVVSEICLHLLNIASQHDHQQLLQPALHLDFLDTLGDHWPQREAFQAEYAHWQQACIRLDTLRSQEREREQRLDFLQFQIGEIQEAAVYDGEDEALGAEKLRLKNAEALQKLSRESYDILSLMASDQLAQVRKNMEQLRALDPTIAELAEILSDYSFLAEDYSSRVRAYCQSVENDPYRLETVSQRLDQLQALKRKYGQSLAEVVAYQQRAEAEVQQIVNLDKQIEEQEHIVAETEQNLMAAAERLSAARHRTATEVEQAMSAELAALAFDHAALEVRFTEPEPGVRGLRPVGRDRVEFYFAPNPGEPARPLAKVASGGELSRLMLALKCLLARKDMVETVIFDEVDAGIGGEAAEAVARKIRELAGHHQVFCITHLPQIAARGTEHYRVEKEIRNGRTQSVVIELTEQERVLELARMLAGESITEQSRAWAEQLLEKGKGAV